MLEAKKYSYDELVNLGFPSKFKVVGAQGDDTTAPEFDDFSITTLIVDDVQSLISGYKQNNDTLE